MGTGVYDYFVARCVMHVLPFFLMYTALQNQTAVTAYILALQGSISHYISGIDLSEINQLSS